MRVSLPILVIGRVAANSEKTGNGPPRRQKAPTPLDGSPRQPPTERLVVVALVRRPGRPVVAKQAVGTASLVDTWRVPVAPAAPLVPTAMRPAALLRRRSLARRVALRARSVSRHAALPFHVPNGLGRQSDVKPAVVVGTGLLRPRKVLVILATTLAQD